jgi:glucose-6-phosphate-specific signal transduction histidine kinase
MCILAVELRKVMERDIKDVIGVLMRVLEGGEISHEELDELAFEADGELETVLNEAYVKLREFANDRDLRLNDLKLDRNMRSELQECLDNIVKACDQANGTPD